MALLAIGTTAMLSGILTQQAGRNSVQATQRMTDIMSGLKERILSEPWSQTTTVPVRGLGVATWCTPGRFTLTTPFTGTGVHTGAELISAGIAAQASSFTDLCYYVEYYRAETLSAAQRGLLDKGVDSNADNVFDPFTSEAEGRAGVAANLAVAQRFTTVPTASIGLEEQLAIRVVLVWRSGSNWGDKTVFGGKWIPNTDVQYSEFILARGAN